MLETAFATAHPILTTIMFLGILALVGYVIKKTFDIFK